MYIKIEKVHFESLELTEGALYEVQEKRETVTEIGNKIIAIDIIDDGGDVETLVNFDEAEYRFIVM